MEFMTWLEPRLLMSADMSRAQWLTAGGRAGSAIFASARPIDKEFDFSRGKRGWHAGFADYPAGEEANFELRAGLKKLPGGVGAAGKKGFFISGNNHSDDLFMFLKRKLGRGDGIKPGQSYRVSFDIDFASEAPEGCAGIGGSPGNSVFLKAGADGRQPKGNVVDGFVTLNVDKGNQGEGGAAASVAGDISNGIDCDEANANPKGLPWKMVHRHHVHPEVRKANEKGQLWLLVGTDSGFEGTTRLYYTKIQVHVEPVSK